MTPRFEHMRTNFGISEESHGGRDEPIGGLGKVLVMSGSTNRDISCFVFKLLEEKGHGFRNIDLTTLGQIIKTVSAFLDDTDAWVNGQGCGEMINSMLQEHATLCETVGGKTQSSKSGFFAWKWVLDNGIKVLQTIEKNIRVR